MAGPDGSRRSHEAGDSPTPQRSGILGVGRARRAPRNSTLCGLGRVKVMRAEAATAGWRLGGAHTGRDDGRRYRPRALTCLAVCCRGVLGMRRGGPQFLRSVPLSPGDRGGGLRERAMSRASGPLYCRIRSRIRSKQRSHPAFRFNTCCQVQEHNLINGRTLTKYTGLKGGGTTCAHEDMYLYMYSAST